MADHLDEPPVKRSKIDSNEMDSILNFEDELPSELMGGWGDMNPPSQGPGKTKLQLNGTAGDGSDCVPHIPMGQLNQQQLHHHHLMQQQ
uniref:Uncharacterized protein n=1 Tax=Megaselia scalaris TaxID=36166 RepID=T1GCF8_MEGSC